MDRNLSAFVVIARTGNLTAAANELHITQPTLTKRLQQLERTYGCALVDRLPRGVKLTTLGHELLPFAKRIEQSHLQAKEALVAAQDGHLDELRVGAGPLFHLKYLAPAFARLREEFGNTRIRLAADLNDRNLPRIRNGTLDIAFGTIEDLPAEDAVEFRRLTEVEQGIIVSANHPLAGRTTISPDKLNELDWIVYSETPENEKLTLSYFDAQGLPPPNIILQTTSLTLGLQMVANSDLAMTLPIQLESIVDADSVRALRTNPPISRKPAGAFCRTSSLAYPVVSRLIEIVQEEIKK